MKRTGFCAAAVAVLATFASAEEDGPAPRRRGRALEMRAIASDSYDQ